VPVQVVLFYVILNRHFVVKYVFFIVLSDYLNVYFTVLWIKIISLEDKLINFHFSFNLSSVQRWKFSSDLWIPSFFFFGEYGNKICQMWSKQVENEVLGELYRVFDQSAPSSLNMEKNEKKNILLKKKPNNNE
jgi:hypothetical protein